jgi:YaiO family outer membrane protein
MRTAIYAGIVAGCVLLNPFAVFAAEESPLRGLRIPGEATDLDVAGPSTPGSEPGLKWRRVDTALDLGPRVMLYGGSLETRRFGIGSANVSVSLYRPQVHGLAGGSASVDRLHDVIPKYTLYRYVSQPLGPQWGLGFGVRHTEYSSATNQLYSVSAERYIGSFRGAYTLYSNRTDGADLGAAHRFQVNYLYGERNSVGLAYTTGRDIENAGLATGPGLADTRDWTLSGRHWLSTNWALTYDLLSHDSGSAYKRQGLRLGVSRSF